MRLRSPGGLPAAVAALVLTAAWFLYYIGALTPGGRP